MSESRYQKRSATEWKTLIERQARSAQSQATFCRSEGVSVSTFRFWKRRLRRDFSDSGRTAAEGPLFASLGVFPAAESIDEEPAGAGGWTLDLDLGDGLRLTLRRGAGC